MIKPTASLGKRKRSKLSMGDCLKVFTEFARRVERQAEISNDWHGEDSGNKITVKFLVWGGFGDNDDVFEAIRVLAGYKLPRATTQDER